ncbi:MAG: 1-(5-phosphoribosyl)-5-[(5-phosphoribosylamino)methylideneamino]imidazole-4-carboxamide isomerase [Halobacteriota archaeon]
MPFDVFPAVDIKDGRCVQLVEGRPDDVLISLDDPVGVAQHWIENGALKLHVIDLDGALGKPRNLKLLYRIAQLDAFVQVGGGVRSYEDVADLLHVGADRVILGTAAVRDPTIVYHLSEEFGTEAIMVSVDARGGEVLMEGWTRSSGLRSQEMGLIFQEMGAGSLLFTDVEVEGRMEGVRADVVHALVEHVDIPVIASGGVGSLDDIRAIAATGAAGVVIGSALYTHKIALSEAFKIVGER